MTSFSIEPIARIHSDFPDKFGIPRQSGLAPSVRSEIIMAPAYREPAAFRGLTEYDYLWLIWGFSENIEHPKTMTVRPPRLGGNTRMGVFATRSPFRPNNLGLSCVKLIDIRQSKTDGPILIISGADLMDGTPIFDIKPYLPHLESHPQARGGFASDVKDHVLEVSCDAVLLQKIPPDKRNGLIELLSQDPRPAYHHDPSRIYGLQYAGFEVRFTVSQECLTITDIYNYVSYSQNSSIVDE